MNPSKVLAVGREWKDSWSSWTGTIPISYLDGGSCRKVLVRVKTPHTFAVYLGIPTNMDLKTLVPRSRSTCFIIKLFRIRLITSVRTNALFLSG